MTKKRKQDSDLRMGAIRAEHERLGRRVWQRGKRRKGVEVKPDVTLAAQAIKIELTKKNVPGWLQKESNVVLKFFKPFWWANPVNWFKVSRMSKRRDLCIYMTTAPHINKMASKRSKPVMLSGMKRFFEPLLRLTNRVSRWFKLLSRRETIREDMVDFRKGIRKRAKIQKARKQVVQKVISKLDDNIADINRRIEQSKKEHQKYMAKSAREGAERERAHKERMAERDREYERKQKAHKEQMARRATEFRAEMADLSKENATKIQMYEEQTRRCMEQLAATQAWVAASNGERLEWRKGGREEAERRTARRLQELAPTVSRLKVMMLMVYIGERSGISTVAQIAKVVAQHDAIASRNGLQRRNFADYFYSSSHDRRLYDGPEPEDAAAVQRENDSRIIKANSRTGLMRI